MNILSGPVLYIPNISKDANSIEDLLERFNIYGSQVKEISKGKFPYLNLIVGGFGKENTSLKLNDYSYLSITFLPERKLAALKTLRRELTLARGNITMLIAGNPWMAYLDCLLLTTKWNTPIQVSIHGNPFAQNNYFSSPKELIKHIWLRFMLRRATSIRLVSEYQIDEVIDSYQIEQAKLSISPIPVNIPKLIRNQKPEIFTIGFVGRIHKERGLDLWIQVVEELYSLSKDFRIIVAGDGRDRLQFERILKSKCPEINLDFRGRLERHQVAVLWGEITLLLSTAKEESFGISLREAQMSGTRVLALKNRGTVANSKLYPEAIALFTDLSSALDLLLMELSKNQILPKSIQKQYRQIQERINLQSINTMVKSWGVTKQ